MKTRNTVLIGILIACTAALPFAAFGLDPALLVVLPAALTAGGLAWRVLVLVRDNEDALNERLARHYARRAVKLMQHARKSAREVQP